MVLLAATCGVLYSTGMSSVLQEQYEANIAKHLVNATNVTQDEAPPAVDPNSAVASAAAGVLLGPLLLLYGYRVQPTIVVLNSFIASGMVHFHEARVCAAALPKPWPLVPVRCAPPGRFPAN